LRVHLEDTRCVEIAGKRVVVAATNVVLRLRAT